MGALVPGSHLVNPGIAIGGSRSARPSAFETSRRGTRHEITRTQDLKKDEEARDRHGDLSLSPECRQGIVHHAPECTTVYDTSA